MKKIIILSYISISMILLTSCLTDVACKRYIIDNKDKIKKDFKYNNYYVLGNISINYYNKIYIKKLSDSSYNVIFWNDKNFQRLNYNISKHFAANILYNRLNNKDIKLDIEIIKILNNIKQ